MFGRVKKESPRSLIRLLVAILLVSLLVSLKLALSVGRLLTQANDGPCPVFVSEVHAADRKANSPKVQPPVKSTSLPESESAPSTLPVEGATVPDVMSHLQQKELELKRKEQLLQEREDYLVRMKQEVEQKLKELIEIQKEIKAYRTEKEENKNAQIRSLSKIYGSMKPKEAAKLLENLNDPLVVSIIATMNAAEAANILANMDIKKAAKISQSLSQQQ